MFVRSDGLLKSIDMQFNYTDIPPRGIKITFFKELTRWIELEGWPVCFFWYT